MGDQRPWVVFSLAFSKLKPYLAMVSLQFGYAGMYIITMVSLKRGMSHWVLVVYRHVVATLVIAPFALVLERSVSFSGPAQGKGDTQWERPVTHLTCPASCIGDCAKSDVLRFRPLSVIVAALEENKAKDDSLNLPQNYATWFTRVCIIILVTECRCILLLITRPVIDQNLYYVGMKDTSATFAAATVNVLPALTFIMALMFRLEKVNIKKVHSQAKVIGTIITVTGAMVMTLYKGPIVDILWYSHGSSHRSSSSTSGQHWVTGTLMLLGCTGGWSGFFILQSITLKEYPAELSLTALICLMGMVEGGVAALVMERDLSAWSIGFDSRLLAAVYSGVVCSGIAYYVQGVVNKIRGPVFVTAFSPLCMIITAVLGAIVLAEQVHLGSLVGAVIIVIGLYSVVWGKGKDHTLTDEKAGKVQELPTSGMSNGDNVTGSAVQITIKPKIAQSLEP
ncbi:hypothetical protein RJ640_021937 [Escallonia rubra]|uniref:EamA domain-containing protein n=1 Tax=Escallonia rubra TaxID=112253 RepID=A0AA88RCH2_9ASTE|nr:hypothetical protein RJ640_021937 [Escallonia rubra]